MTEYGPLVVDGAFGRSAAVFEGVVAELADPVSALVSHGELEERLAERGRELLRQLFQDHADLRAAREGRKERVAGADGVERTRVERGHGRKLATVFGTVGVTRMGYRAVGAANLYPADADWNLPAGLHSHGLARLVALEAVRGSFESAQAAIERATGQRIGKRQIERLAVVAAADIGAFYDGRRPEQAAEELLMVLTFDGKGIVMRPEALRAATAKAAAQAENKMATRLSPGEKNGRKRMAELACVYDAQPVERTATDVITKPGAPRDPARSRGPKATGKWLTGSVTDDTATVITAGFQEAARRDPGRERTWVVLVDGHPHQLAAVHAAAKTNNVQVHIVVDFIHVAKYVWKAAWSFFDKGDSDAEVWVAAQLTKILQGKAEQVATGIRRRATRFGYRPSELTGAEDCITYLRNKAPYLAYDKALAAGWPIATGVIEGACRHLVKDRLDITGARWGLTGAEAILRLRALITSGDFDQYWGFHQSREHDRNHLDRYAQHQHDYKLAA